MKDSGRRSCDNDRPKSCNNDGALSHNPQTEAVNPNASRLSPKPKASKRREAEDWRKYRHQLRDLQKVV